MTSLARQLERLAVPVVQPVGGVDTRRVSLLFNPTEAANLDREAVYCLGVSGLEVLESLDEGFGDYKSSLFSQSSQTWERTVQTTEHNTKLNATIHTFLVQASPYLLVKATHKALEWLIYRFHIHLFNADDIILCALPYHETKIFVRLLQLLKLDNPTEKWHWLHNCAKSGTPLTLEIISNQCKKNPGFLSLICDLVPKFIKVHGPASSHLSHVVALSGGCLLATVRDRDDLTERLVSVLVPHLVRGFKSKSLDYCASCYMVLSMLCSQTTLKVSMVNSLLPVLTKKIRPGLVEEALQCLCIVFQTQQLEEMPKKSFKHLCKLQGFVSLLTRLSHHYMIAAFLKAFLCRLIPLACEPHSMETFSATEGSEDFGQGPPQYSSLLLSIIQEAELHQHLPKYVCRSLLSNLLSQRREMGGDSDVTEAWQEVTRQLLSALEKRYTSEFDAAVEDLYAELGREDTVAVSYLHQMTTFTAMPVKYSRVGDSTCNLSLGLNHAKKSMRIMAARELVTSLKDKQAGDDPSVEEMLLARLKDSEFEVVKEVLELKQRLPEFIGAEKLQSALLGVIENNSGMAKRTDSLLVPVTLLLDCLEDRPDDLDLLLRIIVLLLITVKDRGVTTATVAEMILQEVSKKKIVLLQKTAKEWLKVQYRATEPTPQLLVELNTVLFKSLAESFVKAKNTADILARLSPLCAVDLKFVCLSVGILTEILQLSGINADTRLDASRSLLEVLRMATRDTKVKLQCDLEQLSSPFSHQAELVSHVDGSLSVYFLCWSMSQLASSVAKLKINDTWSTLSDPHVNLQLELMDFFTQKYYISSSLKSVWTKLLGRYIKTDLGRDKFLPLCACLWTNWASFSPELYAGSFTVVAAILSKCRDVKILLKRHKYVFVGLLASLASEAGTVRGAVLDCLKLLKEQQGKEFTHSKLVKRLVRREEEIMADPQHLAQVVGKFYSVSELDSHAERKVSLEDLQAFVTTETTPLPVRESFLTIMSQIPFSVMMDTIVEVGKYILENLQSPDSRGTRLAMLGHLLTRFDEESAELLDINSAALELFIRCLQTRQSVFGDLNPAALAVKQLTKQFFHALPSLDVQQKLFSVVIETILATDDDSEFVTMATGKLRHLKPDACHMAKELDLTDEGSTELRTLKGHKRSKSSPALKPLNIPRLTLVLEVIQARKKIQDSDLLVTLMFKLLNRFLSAPEEGAEYCKQLVLTILHNQCTKWTDETKPKNQELVSAELLVQCLRGSRGNLHTQQQTLHLLSALAPLYPEYILHNVMSVFTFLGSSESGLLQQEDRHSYQTITQTMETLIPALLKAHSGDSHSELLQQHVTQILQVFVDARYHMPKHRTLPLLSLLLRCVGVNERLWVLLVLVVESSVRGKDVPGVEESGDVVDKEKSPLDKDVEFACSICDEIPASVQVVTATKILVFLQKMTAINEAGKGEVSLPPRLRRKPDKRRGFPLNADTLSPQQLRLTQYTVTKMVGVMLSREAFLTQMASELRSPQQSFKADFQTFVEAALSHMNRVSKAYGAHGNQPTARFWKALFGKVSDIMDKVSYLLPSGVFIGMISKLLTHDQTSMRKKAMDLLSNKLQHLDTAAFQGPQMQTLLTLVDMLLRVVESPASEDDSEADHAVMKQFALFNIKVLCKMIGQDNKSHFEKMFPAVVTLMSDPNTQPPVLGNCLLCLSELVTSLKVKAISQLHTFMPPLLGILGNRELLQSNELFLVCTLTALQKVLASLPYFLSPYLLDILVLVSHISCFVCVDGDSSSKKSPPVMRLKAIRQHIATDIPPRVLIPAVNDCYLKLLDENQMGISCILSVIEAHTSHLTREDLSANQNALVNFYCKALDLRNDYGGKIAYARLQEIEGQSVSAVVTMVIRLTELAFRPLFYRLHDWACGDDTQIHQNRKLSFFRLCEKMSEKLRSLFNIFVTHSLKVACHTLEVNNTETSPDGASFYEGGEGTSLSVELVGHILSMLHNCLQYDTEGFVTKEVFNTMMQPMVNQLENFQSLEDVYSDHVTRSVVPAIGQLAVAARDDIAWKSLNYAVCLKTKHSAPKVRFAALKAVEEVAVKLGEEYMSLLPESIPFLAELMEDESEEVEQQCHQLVGKLEELLGESLQSYF